MSAASWFDEDAVPGGDHPLPPLALVAEFPRRVPGATLGGHVPPAASFTPFFPELLRQAAEGIRHLDDAPARGVEPLFAAAHADHYGTAPRPAFTPHPEPESLSLNGTHLQLFLSGLLSDAAEGAGRRITDPCESCTGSVAGWCGDCSGALARAATYERLAEMIGSAAGDREAFRVLLAEAQGGAR
jgi:hypothetical protein